MSMYMVGLSVHAQKWHMPSSKQGGAGHGFCKQVLLVSTEQPYNRCVNGDNMCMNNTDTTVKTK